MKSYTLRFIFTTTLFAVSIILSFLGNYYIYHPLVMYPLLVVCIIYLLFGWYLFKAYHPDGLLPIRFVMGYLYSGIFIGPLFIAADWPLKKTMIWASLFWILIQAGLVLVTRKTILPKGYRQFIIEALLITFIILFLLVQTS